jgi:hypothetical protein
MPLLIGGRGVLLTSAFKDAVTSQVAKLPPLITARATFTIEKDRTTARPRPTARHHLFSSPARA